MQSNVFKVINISAQIYLKIFTFSQELIVTECNFDELTINNLEHYSKTSLSQCFPGNFKTFFLSSNFNFAANEFFEYFLIMNHCCGTYVRFS